MSIQDWAQKSQNCFYLLLVIMSSKKNCLLALVLSLVSPSSPARVVGWSLLLYSSHGLHTSCFKQNRDYSNLGGSFNRSPPFFWLSSIGPGSNLRLTALHIMLPKLETHRSEGLYAYNVGKGTWYTWGPFWRWHSFWHFCLQHHSCVVANPPRPDPGCGQGFWLEMATNR